MKEKTVSVLVCLLIGFANLFALSAKAEEINVFRMTYDMCMQGFSNMNSYKQCQIEPNKCHCKYVSKKETDRTCNQIVTKAEKACSVHDKTSPHYQTCLETSLKSEIVSGVRELQARMERDCNPNKGK